MRSEEDKSYSLPETPQTACFCGASVWSFLHMTLSPLNERSTKLTLMHTTAIRGENSEVRTMAQTNKNK